MFHGFSAFLDDSPDKNRAVQNADSYRVPLGNILPVVGGGGEAAALKLVTTLTTWPTTNAGG